MRTRIALFGAALVAASIVIGIVVPTMEAGARSGQTTRAVRERAPSRVVIGLQYRAMLTLSHPRVVRQDRLAPPGEERRAATALGVSAASVSAASVATGSPEATDATSTTTPDWACIRLHESDDRYSTPEVPGGAYGFLEMTWVSLGYTGWPYQASPLVQSQAALFLYNELGWQPWSTRFVCGL